MVFSTPSFLFFFLPVCMLLYVLAPGLKYKNLALMCASLIFYAWGEPVWVFLMIAVAAVNYAAGRLLDIVPREGRKTVLIAAVALNLASLGLFKYAGFLIDNINSIFGAGIPAWRLSLPIGISFFTFQALSYTIDAYRGGAKVQRSFSNFLLYVSLFPQLIAGPIVRYVDVEREISERKITLEGFSSGVTRFLAGLAKKLLIADYCGQAAATLLTGGSDASLLGGWLGLTLFAFQIYFDFSGYSDMAIGLGGMLGFHFKENFDYPYTAKSITDFWRRWHISLSSFFRDYLYIPLGGNRKHQIPNLLIVWFLTGLWHGASWNFVLWGVYFGVLLILEKFVFHKVVEKLPAAVARFLTLFLVLFSWALFYFEDFAELGAFLSRIFGFAGTPLSGPAFLTVLENNSLLIVAAAIACTPVKKYVQNVYEGMKKEGGQLMNIAMASNLIYNSALLMMCTVVMVFNSYSPFLYFRF